MSTVTPNINLTKPASIEQFSLALLNANSDKIDANAFKILSKNSTFNASNANFTSSVFTRIWSGTKGIVIAQISGSFANGYSVDVPANTASPVNFNASIFPTDMRPKTQVGIVNGAVFSNEARGDNLQIFVASDGIMGIRSQGAGFTRASSGSLRLAWQTVYEWNGVLE